jgi:hypothetical protein
MGLVVFHSLGLGTVRIPFSPPVHNSWSLTGSGQGLSWETGRVTFLVPREASLPFRSCGPGSGGPCRHRRTWLEVRPEAAQEDSDSAVLWALCSSGGAPGSEGIDTSLSKCSQDSKTEPNPLPGAQCQNLRAEHSGSSLGWQDCHPEPCLPLWPRASCVTVPIPPQGASPATPGLSPGLE